MKWWTSQWANTSVDSATQVRNRSDYIIKQILDNIKEQNLTFYMFDDFKQACEKGQKRV